MIWVSILTNVTSVICTVIFEGGRENHKDTTMLPSKQIFIIFITVVSSKQRNIFTVSKSKDVWNSTKKSDVLGNREEKLDDENHSLATLNNIEYVSLNSIDWTFAIGY